MVSVRRAGLLVLLGLALAGPGARAASDGIPIGWSGAAGIPLSQGLTPWEPGLSIGSTAPALSFQFGSVTTFPSSDTWVPGHFIPSDSGDSSGGPSGNAVYGNTPLGEVIGAQVPLNLTQAELVGNAGTIDSACQTLAAQHEDLTNFWNHTNAREEQAVPLNLSIFDQDSIAAQVNTESAGEGLNTWCGGIPIPGWYLEPFYMVVWAPLLVLAVGTLGFFAVRRFQRP